MNNMKHLVIIGVDSSLGNNVARTVRDIIIEFLHTYAESTATEVSYSGSNGLEIEHINKEYDNYVHDMHCEVESIFKNILNALYYNDRGASATAYFIFHNKDDDSRELRCIQRYSSWSDSTESYVYSSSINKDDSCEDKVKWYNEILSIEDLDRRIRDKFTSELEGLVNKEAERVFDDKEEEESSEICITIPKELDEIGDLLNKLKMHIKNISSEISKDNKGGK
jgi:hypothetical protein